MSENVHAHIIVFGVVQMVGFRYFTSRLADDYGLTGWVRNIPHGKVEIEVEGQRSLVTDFIKEIRLGPPSAHVTDVDVRWGDYEGRYTDFRVRF